MLIRFFRSSFIIQYIALVLLTAALWAPGFIRLPVAMELNGLVAPLYHLAAKLAGLAEIISPLATVIIVFVSALTLNNILIFHDLAPKNDLLPALIFIILMGSSPETLGFSPVVMTIPFFAWFLHTIFQVNDEPENYMAVFNASILISVISMVSPEMILLFFLIWIMLLIFGTFNGRNLVISLIGLLVPYLYLGVYYFYTDQLPDALQAYRQYILSQAGPHFRVDYWQLAAWAIFIFLMLAPAFLRITSTLGVTNINFRKKMAATAWFLVFSIPLIFSSGPLESHNLLFLPASVMIAHYFSLFKKPVWQEIVLAVFLVVIILHQYLTI